MEPPTICTIIAKNYLAQARCLTESFLTFHPEGKVFVLLVDKVNGRFVPESEKFETVYVKDLTIPQLPEMTERYGVAELCTAVKPFFLEYLFENRGLGRVCYFDPDIYFYGSINKIWNELEKAAIVLTPHILGPLDEQHRPNEFGVFQAGIFNLGFLGLARGKESDHLLPWWQERLVKYSHSEPERGEHYDQKWMDLIPGFYDKVLIDRNLGYNVAYWDLSNRNVTAEHGRYFVNGAPLAFFHFSGYDPREPEIISKYQDRFTFADLPQLKSLFDHYGQQLLAQGFREIREWPVELQAPTFAKPSPRLWPAGKASAPWLYRRVTSGLAAVGLEKPLTAMLGTHTIYRLQRLFMQPRRLERHTSSAELPFGVNVLGFFEHAGGVGEIARRSVRALVEAGIPMSWHTLEGAGAFSAVEETLPRPQRETMALNMWHVNADILPAVMAQHGTIAQSGAVNVAYWAWELPQFPHDWANRAQLLDEIWVGSNFVQEAVSSVIDIPVQVIGTPIEKVNALEFTRSDFGIPNDFFLFLFTFDFASYVTRKNPKAVIAAYRQAFGQAPQDTMLIFKVLNAHKFPREAQRLKTQLQAVGGRMITEVFPHDKLHALVANCDAYVSLHRSEGFGVTIAEAMAYGKPAIATNYSGNTDYLSEENGYPIPYRLVRLPHDIGPYRAGGVWADPDIAAAAEAVREVVGNQKEARARGMRAAKEISERYSLAAFARRVKQRVTELTRENVWQSVSPL